MSELLKTSRENQAAYKELMSARSFRCQFEPGFLTARERNSFRSEVFPSEEAYGSVKLSITSLKKRAGRVTGEKSSQDCTIIAGPHGLNFIEPGASGLNIFTVFTSPGGAPGEFLAVASRHEQVFGRYAPSQSPGICRVEPQAKEKKAKGAEKSR